MSAYLSADELAALVGCKPTSRACMKRWLKKNGWPFVENMIGFPMVSRTFHDVRLGIIPACSPESDPHYAIEPDFSCFGRLTPHQERMKAARERQKRKQ